VNQAEGGCSTSLSRFPDRLSGGEQILLELREEIEVVLGLREQV